MIPGTVGGIGGGSWSGCDESLAALGARWSECRKCGCKWHGWAGVVAAPIAAAVMAIVVGTTEGIKVVEAARVEPMLRLKLGAAMTENIVIENALTDPQAKNFFFLAYENAAANRFAVPVNTVDGEVRFYNQGGYVAKFTLAYTLNGSRKTFTTPALAVGHEATFPIPAAAQAITVSGDWLDLVEYKNIFVRSIPRPRSRYTPGNRVLAFRDDDSRNLHIIGATTNVTQGGVFSARIPLPPGRPKGVRQW